MLTQRRSLSVAAVVMCCMIAQTTWGQKAPSTNVPPALEIEVLDPSVDANGNPAVVLQRDPCSNGYLVDIPPVILVHRYYYTGNRSFRGPMLPGGPTIAVVNHPRTGERQYVELQMMPGAPRVYYTARSIEYDFGNRGISIVFGKLRKVPVVKYRNHTKISTAVAERVEETSLPLLSEKTHSLAGRMGRGAKTATANATVAVVEAAKTVATPVMTLAKMVPGAQWVLNPSSDQATGAAAAEFHRDRQVRNASTEAFRGSGSITTLR